MAGAPILFVDHATALGGAERSLLLLLEHLDKSRWQPHLAGSSGPLLEEAARLSVRVHALPLRRLRRSARLPVRLLSGALRLARLAEEIGAALLHTNTVRASCYGAVAARLSRRPFLWHVRDFWLSEARPHWPWADRLGKRLLCASARAVITNSESVARSLPCASRARVIYNGIDLESFAATTDGPGFRRRENIPATAPLVGMVGRLRPWKGQRMFLRTAARLRRSVPDAYFFIVGGDPFEVEDDYRASLEKLTRELGLEDRIRFTGELADVRPALAAMDVFVHPGEPEPFGLVNLEAMAMAKPIVGFAHGALPELVADGTTGLLTPPDDDEALAEAIRALLGDRARMKAMGQAARARVFERFDAHRTKAAVEDLYREILG